MSKAPQPAATPSFSRALRFWLKLGCMGFGGPAAQIAMMQSELVDRLRWIDQRAFLRGLNHQLQRLTLDAADYRGRQTRVAQLLLQLMQPFNVIGQMQDDRRGMRCLADGLVQRADLGCRPARILQGLAMFCAQCRLRVEPQGDRKRGGSCLHGLAFLGVRLTGKQVPCQRKFVAVSGRGRAQGAKIRAKAPKSPGFCLEQGGDSSHQRRR